MKTYTRIRERGTVETVAGNGEDRIAAIRAVVDKGQFAKIDGVMMDLFSASLVCQVYDALSDGNKKKFASYSAPAMAEIAYKLVNKKGKAR
ncbi:hypothetical protein KAR91_62435 [Candidatus Pacearchaeota archaeon]|nr:hypothetical protein [Candidatus Pacearchaeota archaeon]